LHRLAPAVYVAFFTLTGLSLKLDTLLAVLPIAAVLFFIRIASIAIGSGLGARVAGESGSLATKGWMAMITQAGIALGLAREAAIQFPALGDGFATLIVAVVVLNEIFGPMLLKFVLGRVGEVGGGDGQSAMIYGIDRNTVQLAERLEAAGWVTTLSDGRQEHLDSDDSTRPTTLIPAGQADAHFEELEDLPDTVVAMSGDDLANLDVCRAAADAGVGRTVARVSSTELLPEFHDVGALVIDPTRAAVALLEDAVRTPDAADLVLHNDETRETRQIRVRAAHVAGRAVRDLRLPSGVLVLAIRRNGTTMTPDGFTTLRRGDDLTVIGEPSLLREVDSRLSQ
jgi:Trk K+ transport system NAD-binding subunit